MTNSVPGPNRRSVLAAGLAATTTGASTIAADTPANVAPKIKSSVRVAAVSFALPFHDHRADGVNLKGLREITPKIVNDKPDFICFPEACACAAKGFAAGIKTAPQLDPYVAEVARIAKEFKVNVIAPFLERSGDRVYNSVPIVDRQGRLVLVYRKNYPTIGELEAGISPGREVPVAECDGIRVGAAVCFDANFDSIAAELERQKARLVFWPSMYCGGQLLQHWALRYGFSVVIAYNAESAIIDMTGKYLARQGNDSLKVRQKLLPPWALADIRINRELFHLDDNQNKFPAMREKYGPNIDIHVMEPEGFFLLESKQPGLTVESIAASFKLETLRDYLARSKAMREKKI